jgi:hypothetical protein
MAALKIAALQPLECLGALIEKEGGLKVMK